MNRIFRIVWSTARGQMVVGNELTKSRSGKKGGCVIAAGMAVTASLAIPSSFAYEVAGGDDCGGGNGRVSIGASSQACVDNSVAIGNGATAPSDSGASGSIAIGGSATAWAGSIAIGRGSYADQSGVDGVDGGLSIGTNATVVNNSRAAIAIGNSSQASGISGLAVGTGASASGANDSIAIGRNSSTPVSLGVAIGSQSSTSDTAGVFTYLRSDDNGVSVDIEDALQAPMAIGGNANAAAGALAFGSNSNASGVNAMAMGSSSVASSASALAFGPAAYATGLRSTAIGYQSAATGIRGMAFGAASTATGQDALAYGTSALASGDRSLAFGSFTSTSQELEDNTQATGLESLAFGTGAQANASRGVAIGQGSSVTGGGSGGVALGSLAQTTNGSSTALGAGAQALATNTISIGANRGTPSVASADGAQAIGNIAQASGEASMAYGRQSVASGAGSIAIGQSSQANADGALAIGGSTEGFDGTGAAQATGVRSLALGNQSLAEGENALAMGTGATASGDQSLSIGTGNTVSGNGAGAIGDPSTVTGDGSYSVGNDNTIDANEAGVFGNRNTLADTATGSRIIGNDNDVDVADAFILGNNAGVTIANSVALGSNSLADGEALDDAPFQPLAADGNAIAVAGTNPVGVVSMGDTGSERRITNVAAGSAETDAVNVSQLSAVDEKADFAAQGFNLSAQDGTASTVAPGGEVNLRNADGNVDVSQTTANGREEVTFDLSDDVTIGNSLTVNNGPTINDSGIDMNGDTITNLGDPVNGGDAVNKTYVDNANDGLVAQGMNFNGNVGGEVHRDLGQTLTITGGATTTGTYSGANLQTMTDPTTGAIGIQMTDQPQFGNVTINDGDSGRITGVTAGIDDTDAVNVSQLNDVGDVADNANQGWNLSAQGADQTNVAPGDSVDLANTDGNLTIAKNGTDGDAESVTFDLSDDVTIGNSLTVNNGPTINDSGIDMNGDTITNLGDPVNGGDAVNKTYVDNAGDELIAQGMDFSGNTGDAVHRDLGETLAITGEATAGGTYTGTNLQTVTDPTTGAIGIQMTDQPQFGNVTINDGDSGRITGVTAGTEETDAVNVSQLNDVSDVANRGWDLSAQGADETNVAPGDSVDLANTDGNLTIAKNATDGDAESVTFDLSDDVTIGNSLTVTNGPTIDGDGIDMNGDTITNLGDPENAGDAVNLDYFNTNRAHYYSINDGGTQDDNYDNDGATGINSMAAGVNASASAKNGLAMGFGATAFSMDGVALGSGAIADREGVATQGQIDTNGDAFIRYNTTDQQVLGAVSVGDPGTGNDDASYRQITNVADGIQSQDAVTIRQLRGAVGSVEQTATLYFHANSPVEDGQDDSLAIGENSVAIGPNTTVNADDGIGMGNGATVQTTAPGGTAIGMNSTAGLADAVAIGTESTANGEQALALGAGAQANDPASVALGSNSVTEGAVATEGTTIDGTDYAFAGIDPAGTVSVGGTRTVDGNTITQTRTITNVAAGRVAAESTDAINGSQLYTTNQALEGIVSDFEDVTGNTDNDFIENNGRGIRYARTNESGLAQTDAFAQAPGGTAVGYEAQASANNALALGRNAIASQTGSVALGQNATTGEAIATEGITIAGNDYAYAGTAPVATVSVGSAGSERTITHVAAGRVSADSTDAINGSQLYATNQAVENIDGRVNAVQGDVNELDGRVTNVEGDVANLGDTVNELDDRSVQYDTDGNGDPDYDSISLGGDDGTTITNVADGDIAENSMDAVNGGQLWQVQNELTNISEGGGIKYFKANSDAAAAQANGAESTAMGPRSVADGGRSTAIGDGAVASSDGGVALGAGSQANRDGLNGAEEAFSGQTVASTQGAVSVGSEGGERQVTHVAGGTQATDAVNVRQLSAVQAGAVNYDRNDDGSVNYGSVTMGREGTPTQIHNVAAGEADTDAANVGQLRALDQNYRKQLGGLYNKIDDVEDQANAGTASALAAASVPQATLPGRSMVAAGAGTYSGESAVSVGVSRLSDNGRWTTKLNFTGDTQSNFGAGVGMGFHW